MLKEMSGAELAEVLTEMANRVQDTVNSNKTVVEKLREEAMKLEQLRKGRPNA